MSDRLHPDKTPKRPLGVIVLVLLVLVIGAQAILAGLGVVEARLGSLGSLLTDPTLFKAVTIGSGVFAIAAAIATWQLRPAGWYATMVLVGTGLLLQIALYVWGTANHSTLALCAATAFYLNQREVKARFLTPRTEPTTVVLTRDDDGDEGVEGDLA